MKRHEIDRHKNMSTQLGMPRGTAANRLRKMVLFDILKRHKENICVRCSKEIETVEELSIEHIKPWEHEDTALFWDLTNIGFSHLKCNCAAARRTNTGKPSSLRIVPPDGMSWCRTHKQFLSIDSFSKHNQRWSGIKVDCKECEKKYKDFHRYGR